LTYPRKSVQIRFDPRSIKKIVRFFVQACPVWECGLIQAANDSEMTEEKTSISVAVLGLGNPVLCDDAVGLHVAAEVERLLRKDSIPGVTVLTSTRAGFDLINLLAGFTHALIIDCLELPEPIPGRIRLLDLHCLSGSARLVGGHDISVADAFELATVLGTEMPGIVEIYAVEGGDTQTLCEKMTPAVAAAVAPLAHSVLARADEWVKSAHPAAG
jgi:hydrogenase maturation protease